MPKWRICLNTSTIQPASLIDKISIAAEAGYAGIELWNDDLIAFEEQGGSLNELRRRLQDAGLATPSIVALRHWLQSEGVEKEAAFEDARRRMTQAAILGVPSIVAAPTPDSPHIDIGRAAARYRELLDLGRVMGVMPSVEFLGFFNNVYQLEQAVAIARQADHPDACIVVDPFHLYRGGSGFGGLRLLDGVKISICHFNDSPTMPPQFELQDADRIYPGDGIVPLRQMLIDLASIGYEGYLSIELFNPIYWRQDLKQVARTAREKVEKLIAAKGETAKV